MLKEVGVSDHDARDFNNSRLSSRQNQESIWSREGVAETYFSNGLDKRRPKDHQKLADSVNSQSSQCSRCSKYSRVRSSHQPGVF